VTSRETRVTQIEQEAEEGDADPLGEWEANCLGRVRAWLAKLKKLTKLDHVEMALATLRTVAPEAKVVLTMSTSHVTEEGMDWLADENSDCPAMTYAKGEVGLFVPVSPFTENPMPDDAPACVVSLIEHARTRRRLDHPRTGRRHGRWSRRLRMVSEINVSTPYERHHRILRLQALCSS
jgi:hypothetical protein